MTMLRMKPFRVSMSRGGTRRLGLMMMTPTRVKMRMRRMMKRMWMTWMRMMMTRVD
jgi:hypothetical protein